ncbi:MAG: lactonase family protein [Niabella sp.]
MKSASIIILHATFLLLCNTALWAQRLVVGTYTHTGTSKGIYIYDFDVKTGRSAPVSYVETENPSYLVINDHHTHVYAVNEGDPGHLSSFSYDKNTGRLHFLNKVSSEGSAPCYISIDKTGKWLFAGNYSSGNLTVHSINPDGTIGALHQFVQHAGAGINTSRQEGPHVHCTYVGNDNKHLYVPDLGLDKVMVYPFDASTGLLDSANKTWIAVAPGGGPRHIVFSKNGRYAYLAEEMSGNVNVILKTGNNYKIIQTENHLPRDQEGAGADIHLSPDEKFLYVSQRSNSTIQIFKVDATKGTLKYIGGQSTMGNFPRNFTIHPSGRYLLAANQKSNDITVFKRDIQTGLLTDTKERIKVGVPVCLQWIN